MSTLTSKKIVRYALSFSLCFSLISVGTEAKGESTPELIDVSNQEPEAITLQVEESSDDVPALFSDIDQEHWAFDEIQELVENDIVLRPHEENFDPNNRITRAELIRLILRAKGVYTPELAITNSRFKDVSPESDTYPYIEVAYSMAITNGNTQGTFNPLGAISREKTIAMIIRAMGKEEEAKQFPLTNEVLAPYADQDEITPIYRELFAYAVAHDMVTGAPREGKLYLEPGHFTTRAEAAAMVARFILPEREDLLMETVDGMDIFYQKKMELEATAYSSDQPNLSKYTSTGLLVRQGIVAVNPEVIPYGTHLYIEGYGFAVAGDTGGSMLKNGHKIDVAFGTLAEAKQFGRKKVQVYFLNQ